MTGEYRNILSTSVIVDYLQHNPIITKHLLHCSQLDLIQIANHCSLVTEDLASLKVQTTELITNNLFIVTGQVQIGYREQDEHGEKTNYVKKWLQAGEFIGENILKGEYYWDCELIVNNDDHPILTNNCILGRIPLEIINQYIYRTTRSRCC